MIFLSMLIDVNKMSQDIKDMFFLKKLSQVFIIECWLTKTFFDNRHGFQGSKGVRTTASSGRAHDYCLEGTEGRRAMLVCRVIAGRVRRSPNDNVPAEQEIIAPSVDGSYDSIGGSAGVYSNLEELVVFNPRAILPCFVVIYNTLTVA